MWEEGNRAWEKVWERRGSKVWEEGIRAREKVWERSLVRARVGGEVQGQEREGAGDGAIRASARGGGDGDGASTNSIEANEHKVRQGEIHCEILLSRSRSFRGPRVAAMQVAVAQEAVGMVRT